MKDQDDNDTLINLRSKVEYQEKELVREIDFLSRQLRALKRIVKGEEKDDDFFVLAGSSGLSVRGVQRAWNDLSHTLACLHLVSGGSHPLDIKGVKKRGGQWCFFKPGLPADAGWHTLDGEHPVEE